MVRLIIAQKGAGVYSGNKKCEKRRRKCVGSAPTKWIFVFVVIVSAFPCDYSKNRHIAVKMQETMQ